jgi:hypothetical protein
MADDDSTALCIRLCVTLAFVAGGVLFTFMSREAHGREKDILGSGDSLEPPGPLPTHLHTA